MPEMLHVATYSTSQEKMQFLKASGEIHGIQIQNTSNTTVWSGFQDKIKGMRQFLSTLPDTDIVCFLDAYDVIVNADSETILSVFRNANTDILFGAEVNLFPSTLSEESYPESSTPFRFLNSGCYIGYVHAIKNLWNSVSLDESSIDDQYVSHTYFLKNQDNVKLDNNTNLVLNMESVPWDTLQISEGVVQYIPLETTPCFIHFNGMSYLDMDKDCKMIEGNVYGFEYKKVYTRVFSAILSSKIHSYKVDVVCKLTGHGTTYE